jgi:hypothetical protein
MGTGYGNGPHRCREARQAGFEDSQQRELRHEHAHDEQRLRHLDVAERRLSVGLA